EVVSSVASAVVLVASLPRVLLPGEGDLGVEALGAAVLRPTCAAATAGGHAARPATSEAARLALRPHVVVDAAGHLVEDAATRVEAGQGPAGEVAGQGGDPRAACV